jgi:hypothetical protein
LVDKGEISLPARLFSRDCYHRTIAIMDLIQMNETGEVISKILHEYGPPLVFFFVFGGTAIFALMGMAFLARRSIAPMANTAARGEPKHSAPQCSGRSDRRFLPSDFDPARN